ncbi:Mrp/NBP35 family ATP-binding protein [Thermosipho ferrireducens]|uniref:Iron-sulfur cluster carrier protein n=2 Tax=Thermosipho ferrireducens TaxID=2571116 RepID=A0ABX7SAC6_9BACT|nr:Mrp/NBP35 family ATP-binding protein [Thermosipho ferrireducens]QTA38885.1 Mrp/NBP35 family ATP-binding protein [Thermosipho ferrireducens]
MGKIKHKIAVLSGKGGVGKTTVAVNLATALAESGYKVGLLDLDMHGPNIVRMLGSKNPTVDGEEIVPAEVLHNLKALSIGMLVEEGKAVIWRGPLKHSAIKQFLGDTKWGELDYLVFDLPPGTGDEALSLFQMIGKLDGVVMVTTPQKISLDDVRRAVSFVQTMGQKLIGIVENMSYVKCSKCDEIIEVFGSGGGEILAKEYNVPLLGKVPLDPKAAKYADEGKPITLYLRETEIEQVFRDIAEQVAKIVEVK